MSQSQHVGPVIFSNETARGQLEEHGVVITFRTRERTTGSTWWRESRTGPKRGDCWIFKEEDVDPRQPQSPLENYVELSGFDSVEDWLAAIRELHGKVPPSGYLYRVGEYPEPPSLPDGVKIYGPITSSKD